MTPTSSPRWRPRSAPPGAAWAGVLRAWVLRAVVALAVALASLLAAPLATAGPRAAASDGWQLPVAVPVAVLRAFDPPDGPYAAGHRGVDLAAAPGRRVRAAGAGTVVVAEHVAGIPVVVIAHGPARTADELRTTYQPVITSLRPGARVGAGSELGEVGSWPDHCARGGGEHGCVHWGLRRGTTYLDPLALLEPPVRLLPVGGPSEASAPRSGSAPDAPRAAPESVGTAEARGPAGAAPLAAAPLGTAAVGAAALGAAAVGAAAVGTLAARRRRTRAPLPRDGPRRS